MDTRTRAIAYDLDQSRQSLRNKSNSHNLDDMDQPRPLTTADGAQIVYLKDVENLPWSKICNLYPNHERETLKRHYYTAHNPRHHGLGINIPHKAEESMKDISESEEKQKRQGLNGSGAKGGKGEEESGWSFRYCEDDERRSSETVLNSKSMQQKEDLEDSENITKNTDSSDVVHLSSAPLGIRGHTDDHGDMHKDVRVADQALSFSSHTSSTGSCIRVVPLSPSDSESPPAMPVKSREVVDLTADSPPEDNSKPKPRNAFALMRGWRTGDKPTPFKCHVCDLVLSNATSHERHMQIHKGETYRCEECGIHFRRENELDKHTSTHVNGRPLIHICSICNEAFAYAYNLKYHMQSVHDQTKPRVECPECGKGFRKPSDLKKHIRVHTGEKLFVCDHPGCDKEYGYLKSLIEHKRNIHENPNYNRQAHMDPEGKNLKKPYGCEVPGCGKRYQTKDGFRWHMQKKHQSMDALDDRRPAYDEDYSTEEDDYEGDGYNQSTGWHSRQDLHSSGLATPAQASFESSPSFPSVGGKRTGYETPPTSDKTQHSMRSMKRQYDNNGDSLFIQDEPSSKRHHTSHTDEAIVKEEEPEQSLAQDFQYAGYRQPPTLCSQIAATNDGLVHTFLIGPDHVSFSLPLSWHSHWLEFAQKDPYYSQHIADNTTVSLPEHDPEAFRLYCASVYKGFITLPTHNTRDETRPQLPLLINTALIAIFLQNYDICAHLTSIIEEISAQWNLVPAPEMVELVFDTFKDREEDVDDGGLRGALIRCWADVDYEIFEQHRGDFKIDFIAGFYEYLLMARRGHKSL